MPESENLLPRQLAPDGILPPRRMSEHTLESIREEICVAAQRVYSLQVDLNGAEEYLAALRVREAGLVLRGQQKAERPERGEAEPSTKASAA